MHAKTDEHNDEEWDLYLNLKCLPTKILFNGKSKNV